MWRKSSSESASHCIKRWRQALCLMVSNKNCQKSVLLCKLLHLLQNQSEVVSISAACVGEEQFGT